MPAKSTRPEWAVDTSVAIAALDASHSAHAACRDVVRQRRPVLAGHAAFETYSVLTRMPGALSIGSDVAAELMRKVFPSTIWLSSERAATLIRDLGTIGIVGGAVYDAVVGEVARMHSCVLLTRDRRAKRTYDLIGTSYQFVGID